MLFRTSDFKSCILFPEKWKFYPANALENNISLAVWDPWILKTLKPPKIRHNNKIIDFTHCA